MMIATRTFAVISLLCIIFSTTITKMHFIKPFENSSCPSLSLPCDTLEEFIKTNATKEAVMTLAFLSGNHSLWSELMVINTQRFVMLSEREDMFIECFHSARFLFKNVTTVEIKGLKFVGCGENSMHFVRNLSVIESMFIGTMYSGTSLVLNETETQIEDSQFVRNTIGRAYYYNNTIDSGSGGTEEIHVNVSGAIFITNSNTTLVRCNFDGNMAANGGALFVENKSNLTLIECSFLNSNGSVIDANDSFITDHFSIYENNTADLGAVIYVLESNFSIIGSRFYNNIANSKGGVVLMYKSNVSFNQCEAIGNSANNGGVVYQLFGLLVITASTITQNNASEIGILNIEGCALIIDTVFSFNQAKLGVIYLSESESFNISNTSIIHNNVTTKGILYAQDSTIKGNGKLDIEDNVASLSIVYIVRCNAILRHMVSYANNSASFTVINSIVMFYDSSTFIHNGFGMFAKASEIFAEGGAITAIQSTVSLHGHTKIEDNFSASFGGGIYAIESIIEMLYDVCIKHNKANGSGGGVYLYSSVLCCEKGCNISSNKALNEPGLGGGIHAIGSSILVSIPPPSYASTDYFDKKEGFIHINYTKNRSILRIENNTAIFGGGLNFEENSKLYIQGDSNRVRFNGNTAHSGGAIFISDNTTASVCASDSFANISIKTECFVQQFYHDSEGYITTKTVTNDGPNPPIEFTNNFAYETGSILFGGLLDRCTVSPLYYKTYVVKGTPITHISGLAYIKNNISFADNQDDASIDSEPVRICFCETTESQHDCSYHPQPYQVMKGEKFNVTLVAVNQVNRSVKAVIKSFISDDGDLGERQTVLNSSEQCKNFTFSVKSSRKHEELTIYAEGPCYSLGKSRSSVKVIFKNCTCPIGFQKATDTTRECKCDCDETLKPYVTCDHLTKTIQRKPKHNVWIGTCDENVTDTSSQYCFIIHPNCPFDYCIPPTNYSIDLSTSNGLDTQCAFHRSGLLCGSCKPGWSLSIGSSGCIKCPKSWPGLVVAIIVYIIFFGVIMVAVIVVLDLTVAKGTINGVLFYANVVGSSSNIFLKVESTKVLTIFLNFLNVTIGFDACFSERMNAILKTWLGLLFSGYVFALIFILI